MGIVVAFGSANERFCRMQEKRDTAASSNYSGTYISIRVYFIKIAWIKRMILHK